MARTEEDNSVGITGPGGFTATATGVLAPIALVMVAIGVTMIYLVNAEVARGNLSHQEIQNHISRLADAVEVQNWLQSIPENKRPRLLKPFGADRYLEKVPASDR